MRLADAIALGRMLKKPQPGDLGIGADFGCAMGMALAAVGSKNSVDMATLWPWAAKINNLLPCGCGSRGGYTGMINGTIAHLFDQHVYGACDWTLDQLIKWVDSQDPTPREEEPCTSKSTVNVAESELQTLANCTR